MGGRYAHRFAVVGQRSRLVLGAILLALLLARCKREAAKTVPKAPDACSEVPDGSAAPSGSTAASVADILLSADTRVQCVAKGAVLHRMGYRTDAIRRRTEFDASIVSVSCSHMTACVVTTKHEVWCLGGNDFGEIGVPTSEECDIGPCSRVPRKVLGLPPIVEVATEAHASCAVGEAGQVFCWGWHGAALGESVNPSQRPARSEGVAAIAGLPRVRSVAVGSRFACALTREGEVWCWGNSADGQLGRGLLGAESEPPARVPTLPKATALSAGLSHACALSEKDVWCWGTARDSQTGTEGQPCGSVPCALTHVNLPAEMEPVAVDLAGNSSCALMKTGELYCWGQDVNETLGAMPEHCPFPCVKRPRNIEGIPPLVAISHGGTHTCGRSRAGELVCWGGVVDAGLVTSCGHVWDGGLLCLDGGHFSEAPPSCAGCVGSLVRLDMASLQ
jgi:alpha-tubulin suppressor-like RCC1 family protein